MAFDWVKCYYPLPDKQAQSLDFITQSTFCILENYEISEQGRLILNLYDHNQNLFAKVDLCWHGTIKIYGESQIDKNLWFAYNLIFIQGQLRKRIPSVPYWEKNS